MAGHLPRGRFIGFKDLSDGERLTILLRSQFTDDGIEPFYPAQRILISLEGLKPRKDYILASVNHAVTYAPVRRSLRDICKIYRKVKRSNCIVRCYLKTTEAILEEFFETFEPCLFLPVSTIDALALRFMRCAEELVSNPPDQFLPITSRYMKLAREDIQYRLCILKSIALDNMRDMMSVCTGCLPENWVPKSFMPRTNVYNGLGIDFLSTSTSSTSSTNMDNGLGIGSSSTDDSSTSSTNVDNVLGIGSSSTDDSSTSSTNMDNGLGIGSSSSDDSSTSSTNVVNGLGIGSSSTDDSSTSSTNMDNGLGIGSSSSDDSSTSSTNVVNGLGIGSSSTGDSSTS